MPRPNLTRNSFFPYHVTSRTRNKDWYQIPLDQVWNYSIQSLSEAHRKISVNIHAFVLMHNHYHLLVQTPGADLDKFMYHFNKRLSQRIRKASARINQIFGGRYKWSLVDEHDYLSNVYRYIFQNPLRAKMVRRCQDYPFSTYHYQYFNKTFPLPILDLINLRDIEFEKWVNDEVAEKENLAIKRGLKRKAFVPGKAGVMRKQVKLSPFTF